MQSYQGKSVYKGIAMGPVVVLKKNDYQVKRTRIEDPEAEIKRVDEALEKSKEQLQKLYMPHFGIGLFQRHIGHQPSSYRKATTRAGRRSLTPSLYPSRSTRTISPSFEASRVLINPTISCSRKLTFPAHETCSSP